MATGKRIRISGLVKITRWAREQLAVGIAPQEIEAFRRQVCHTVQQVETLCHTHHVTPQDLPTPSYQAYRFLKDLDLAALPLRREAVSPPGASQTVRITNIVTAQSTMNFLFAEWATASKSQTVKLTPRTQVVKHFLDMLGEHIREIEELAQKQGGSPAQLPTPSRRAYQWLKYLCDPDVLIVHLNTVRVLLSEFQHPHCRLSLPKSARLPVNLELVYSSHLYRIRTEKDSLSITLHEGFSGAPQSVLRDLVCAVLLNDKNAYRESVRAYSASEEFFDVLTSLELTIAGAESITRGHHHDLAQAFERVNATYFAGQLSPPRLAWSNTFTSVKLGHYDFLRDTVMLSLTLDTPHVPEYVVDFVMYHELLHKQLGVNVVNGRRYAHTPEFRAAEQRFAQYTEARALLERLTASRAKR